MTDWVQGNSISRRQIKKWVEIVNAEIGRSNTNEYVINEFCECRDYSYWLMKKWGYAVICMFYDTWGDMEANVVSFYVKPKFRTFKRLCELQDSIEKQAKAIGAKFVIQGSHFGDKTLFKFWKRRGYSEAVVKKEL